MAEQQFLGYKNNLMFKLYQRLKVRQPDTAEIIEVYYLANYIGHSTLKSTVPITRIICSEIVSNKLYHVDANKIIDIIEGVN